MLSSSCVTRARASGASAATGELGFGIRLPLLFFIEAISEVAAVIRFSSDQTDSWPLVFRVAPLLPFFWLGQ